MYTQPSANWYLLHLTLHIGSGTYGIQDKCKIVCVHFSKKSTQSFIHEAPGLNSTCMKPHVKI